MNKIQYSQFEFVHRIYDINKMNNLDSTFDLYVVDQYQKKKKGDIRKQNKN